MGGTDIYRSVVAGQHRRERMRRAARGAFYALLALLLVAVAVLGIGIYRLGGESMAPGLHTGDLVLVNKLAYGVVMPFRDRAVVSWRGPRRGDVVLASLPRPKGDLIAFKRVVGVPGDRVEVRWGRLTVNGEPATYQVLHPLTVRKWPGEEKAQPEAETFDGRSHQVIFGVLGGPPAPSGMTTVPPGQYFVLGDSRDNSEDSRLFGPLPSERILGRLAGVLWKAKKEES